MEISPAIGGRAKRISMELSWNGSGEGALQFLYGQRLASRMRLSGELYFLCADNRSSSHHNAHYLYTAGKSSQKQQRKINHSSSYFYSCFCLFFSCFLASVHNLHKLVHSCCMGIHSSFNSLVHLILRSGSV